MKKGIAWRRVSLVMVGILLFCAVAAAVFLHDRIKTVLSIRRVTNGFYQMDYAGNYKLDELLAANISTETELESWLSENQFFGYPVSANSAYYGCSSFSAVSPAGSRLMGRNFDYDRTETLIIYADPEDGYASYGMVDLDILGVGEKISCPLIDCPER